MLNKVMFSLFGLLVLAPLMVFAQAKMDRTKPVGAAMMDRMNIIEAAKTAGMFKTLLAAAEASGWEKELKGQGPFTVFAPTDEAFAKLPEGTLENLLKPENKAMLVKILTYHIVKGSVSSKDVMTMTKAKTVQGKELKISSKDEVLMIDDAKIVQADIYGGNGTIHAIDKVLMPN